MNESAPAEGPREEPARKPDGPVGDAPAPRRTRSGAVVVGPTAIARWLPLALVGLPIIALLLCPFAATGIAQWQQGRAAAGLDDLLTRSLGHGALQLLAGAIVLWILFALWALVPILATHKVALLDEDARTLTLRRGLRTAGTAPLGQVVYAVGEAEPAGRPAHQEERHWVERVGGHGPAVGVTELVGVAVVGGDRQQGAGPAGVGGLDRLDRRDDASQARVDHFEGGQGRIPHPGVSDHVRVGEVDDPEAIGALAPALAERVGGLGRAHLRPLVVCGDVSR